MSCNVLYDFIRNSLSSSLEIACIATCIHACRNIIQLNYIEFALSRPILFILVFISYFIQFQFRVQFKNLFEFGFIIYINKSCRNINLHMCPSIRKEGNRNMNIPKRETCNRDYKGNSCKNRLRVGCTSRESIHSSMIEMGNTGAGESKDCVWGDIYKQRNTILWGNIIVLELKQAQKNERDI